MKRALVTGATGFIGKNLVSYLSDLGMSVRVLIRNPHDFPDQIEQHFGDLTKPKTLIGAAENIDIVFHLGGYAHACEEGVTFDWLHREVNLNGVKHIFEECIRVKVKKFIFFSTTKAVGNSQRCIDEKWTATPDTPYGKAKKAAEDLVLMLGKKHNIHVSILRLPLVYGPLVKGNLYNMLRAIDKGYFLPIPSVNNRRSLVSVYDVCCAAWLAATRDQSNGKIYFVTDQIGYSSSQIYSLMRTALGFSKKRWSVPLVVFKLLAFVGDRLERTFHRRFLFNSQAFGKLFDSSEYSTCLIKAELGFQPKFSLNDMLPEIVKSYRNNNICKY